MLISDGIAAYPMPVPMPITVVPAITCHSEPVIAIRSTQPTATMVDPSASVCGAPRTPIIRAATGAKSSIARPLGSSASPPVNRLEPRP